MNQDSPRSKQGDVGLNAAVALPEFIGQVGARRHDAQAADLDVPQIRNVDGALGVDEDGDARGDSPEERQLQLVARSQQITVRIDGPFQGWESRLRAGRGVGIAGRFGEIARVTIRPLGGGMPAERRAKQERGDEKKTEFRESQMLSCKGLDPKPGNGRLYPIGLIQRGCAIVPRTPAGAAMRSKDRIPDVGCQFASGEGAPTRPGGEAAAGG